METIEIEKLKSHWTVYLNRPEIHNALNEVVMKELIQALEEAKLDTSCRLVVLAGRGRSFCAGADLNYMKAASSYSKTEHQKASLLLHQMFTSIYNFPKPVISKVHGAAVGGGLGLLAASDFVIAVPGLKLSFSEVRLGLAPAVISPFIIRKIGESRSRKLFLSGELFDSKQALDWGLIDYLCESKDLDQILNQMIEKLYLSSPQSIQKIKSLMDQISGKSLEEASQFTTRLIAECRVSEEGQEGMKAFLEKRKAKWVP